MNQMADERIARGQNRFAAHGFWMMLALQVLVLVVKLLLGATLRVCWLDMAVLTIGIGGVVLLRSVKGLWGPKDEALREVDEALLAKLFMVLFWLVVVGEFVLFFADGANWRWYVPCLIIWGIPALYVVIRSLRSGLVVWGSQRAENTGKIRLMKRTAVGALFFGLVMGGPDCFREGAFQLSGLWKVLGMAACWGVLFYLGMVLFLKVGEKSADQLVQNAEQAAAQEEASHEE